MASTKPFIREIAPEEYINSARIIRNSFKTVADEFGLTRENAPYHTAFLTVRQLRELRNRGGRLFGLFLDGKQAGFIAIEKADDLRFLPPSVQKEGVYWLERLAVLPANRHEGYGGRLIGFAIDYIKKHQGKRVALGMMNEHKVLKDWYLKLGFRQVSTRKFPGMPFSVCFMERDLTPLTVQP